MYIYVRVFVCTYTHVCKGATRVTAYIWMAVLWQFNNQGNKTCITLTFDMK